jgi:hypothetical protein
MNKVLLDYFRCQEDFADLGLRGNLSKESGFFRIDQGITGYGQCVGGPPSPKPADQVMDASRLARCEQGRVGLPFDLTQVVDNLRHERYVTDFRTSSDVITQSETVRRIYYWLRPALPVSLRKHLQRMSFNGWREIVFPRWPVDLTTESLMAHVLALVMRCHRIERFPFIWFWPNGAAGCAIMTHDVETAAGRDFCRELMNLDDAFHIGSSFQIIPEARYTVTKNFLNSLRSRGFEVNVHDLNHDGFLFRTKEEFMRRAGEINRYAKEFGAEGFRSGAMYRNQDWYDFLAFSYDMSVPNVAHLEPQRGGCCTVMPYFVGKLLELPLTTIQDYSLFHIVGDYSINLWRRQIELIMQRHGLISFITHPDYLTGKRAQKVYVDLLSYLDQLRTRNNLWLALPREVNRWWRNRHQMRLVQDGDQWRIEGPDSERARIAYATREGDRAVYSLDSDTNRGSFVDASATK